MRLLFGKYIRCNQRDTEHIGPFYSAALLFLLLSLVISFSFAEDGFCDQSGTFKWQAFEKRMDGLSHKAFKKDRLIQLTKAMGAYSFSDKEIGNVFEILSTVRKEKLPLKYIEEKLYEGMVKKVPTQRIIFALSAVQSRIQYAHGSLNSFGLKKPLHQNLTQKLFDSLTAGLSLADEKVLMSGLKHRILSLRASEKPALMEECLKTVRMMLRTGVSSPQTIQIMGQALGKNYTAKDMTGLREAFKKQIKSSSPKQAADQMVNQFRHGQNPGSSSLKGRGGQNSGDESSGDGTKNKGKGNGNKGNGGNKGKGKGKKNP